MEVPDLSTFDSRWSAAVPYAQDFTTNGGKIGGVNQRYSRQCRRLRDGQSSTAWRLQSQTGAAVPRSTVGFLNVGNDERDFLYLEKPGEIMFTRSFYDALYQQLLACWTTHNRRVLVKGNAGTGKSWFQLFALRRLMIDYGTGHDFLYVIRQAGSAYDLIDLATGDVRPLEIASGRQTSVLNTMNVRVLYFFEPLTDTSLYPSATLIPSLSTLSPHEDRISEYKKTRCTIFIFPCLSLSELLVIAWKDPMIQLTEEQVELNFTRFGGIVRHVLAQDTSRFLEDQKNRIETADPTILRARSVNIDYKPTGGNVSGFLLSFCNIPLEGPNQFKYAELDFTSMYVEQAIRAKLSDYSLQDHVNIVLDHIGGKQVDRSGLHLQESVGMMLSKGSQLVWKMTMVGDTAPVNAAALQWSTFRTQKREVVKLYTIVEQLRAAAKLLISTNPNFPLGDIVFSQKTINATIDVVQITWQQTHPFTLRALYMLRVLYLKIADNVPLRVFFVAPNLENQYALRARSDFLVGDLQQPLLYSSAETVPASRLQLMYQNTSVFILKPEGQWHQTLLDFRKTG